MDPQDRGVQQLGRLKTGHTETCQTDVGQPPSQPQELLNKLNFFSRKVKTLEAEKKALEAEKETLKAEKQRLWAENARLRAGMEKLKKQQTDAIAFLKPRTQQLADRCAQARAAQPYARQLYKWIGALQEVIGLAHALDAYPETELREFWAERYLQRVSYLRLEAPEAEDDYAGESQAEREAALEGGLPDALNWWLRTESELKKNSGALREQDLAERLRPMLAELRAMKPADCLKPEGLALLRRTAETAESGLRELGFFPEFYGSKQTRAQMELDPEVADAFNEGGSASVEIPAVFLRRDGRWELLSGHVGLTLLKQADNS